MNNLYPKDSPASGFQDLGIASALLGVLKRMKIVEPTPIQKKSIPIALEGGSVGDAFKVELVEDAHGILLGKLDVHLVLDGALHIQFGDLESDHVR